MPIFNPGLKLLLKAANTPLEPNPDHPIAYLHLVDGDGNTIVPEYELDGLRTSAGPVSGAKITIPETDLTAVNAAIAAAGVPGGELAFSPPRMAVAGTVVRAATGSHTHGIAFFTTKACNCVGIEGYWAASGTETVRGELWQHIGTTSLANASVLVSVTGLYVVTFASPIALTPYTLYYATQCVSGSGANTQYTTNSATTGITLPAIPAVVGNGLVIVGFNRYAVASNSIPNTGGGAFYPVMPLFE